MELPIFNNILFLELRPGQIDTTDRKKFLALVKTADAVSPANYGELLAQLSTLLSDFPELQKSINSQTSLKVKLQPLLFSATLPRYTDPFTQFYSLLIERETLRVSNLLIQQVAAIPDELGKRHEVKLTLRSLCVLAAKTAKHLRESGCTAFPDGGSTLEHFVFFTQKQMLSALFFEIQERFKDLLTPTETEESFSNNYLQQPDNPLQLQHTLAYFEYHLKRFTAENKFSAQAAHDLLSQIPQDAKFANLQAALENLIFLHTHNHNGTTLAFVQLTDQDFVAEHVSLAKQATNAQLQSLRFGHERLDVVNPILDKLDYVTSAHKLSIPNLYRKWLSEQKEIYTARFTEKFPVIARSKKQKDNSRKTAKATFGFHGDTSKLKTVLAQLSKVDLLNEEKNNTDELFALLTSKDLNGKVSKIFINCETAQFRYIIDKLSPLFSNLTPKTIGKSGLFYSKKGTSLTDQNLYSSRIDNPKDKETIDKILKQLQ